MNIPYLNIPYLNIPYLNIPFEYSTTKHPPPPLFLIIAPTITPYSYLISAFGTIGQEPAEIMKVFGEIKEQQSKCPLTFNFYTTLMSALVRSKRPEWAQVVFGQLLADTNIPKSEWNCGPFTVLMQDALGNEHQVGFSSF